MSFNVLLTITSTGLTPHSICHLLNACNRSWNICKCYCIFFLCLHDWNKLLSLATFTLQGLMLNSDFLKKFDFFARPFTFPIKCDLLWSPVWTWNDPEVTRMRRRVLNGERRHSLFAEVVNVKHGCLYLARRLFIFRWHWSLDRL